MTKSFYHFLMKFRDSSSSKDDISLFANNVYEDHSFPKHSTDFYEISAYLELNGTYLSSMNVFDEAWEEYVYVEDKKSVSTPSHDE
ncbi:YozE family protein [Bacillus spongiae]|uniref:UPF0346 protein WAK64_09635 n=1 Tax=Bacillus spongiae TaxID=2683610 RepID=A0ABU8HDQ7_9BACI